MARARGRERGGEGKEERVREGGRDGGREGRRERETDRQRERERMSTDRVRCSSRVRGRHRRLLRCKHRNHCDVQTAQSTANNKHRSVWFAGV